MPTVIDRYLIKRFLFWFFIILLTLIAIISLFEMMEFLRRTVGRPHVKTASLFLLTAYKMPSHILMIFPFICMITTQVTLSKFNHDNEIIAIRALGVSVVRLLTGIFITTFALCILVLCFLNPLSAIGQKKWMYYEPIIFSGTAANSDQLMFDSTGLWLRETDQKNQNARIIHLGHYQVETKNFLGIDIVETTKSGSFQKRYIAEKALLENGSWHLINVKMWILDEDEKQVPDICLDTDYTFEKIQENNIQPDTISFWELSHFISLLKQSGLSTIRYEIHLYSQIAKLIQALSLILLAAVFCLKPIRYYKASVLIFSGMILAFSLHFLTDIIHALGKSYKMPVIFSAFSPAVITTFLSIGLIVKSEYNR
jgi:lipopolysaccharide export system permease protein